MNNSMNFLDAIMNGDEEAMHYAVYLYEQEEKYRWHNLKKDPNDLPDNFHNILICVNGFEGNPMGVNVAVYNSFSKRWGTESTAYKDYEVVAWREIDPFEG